MVHPVLEIRALNVFLPGGLALLRDVDLTLEAGRIRGVIGESGAGKSMIGRIIAGVQPTAFRVVADRLAFDGQELTGLAAWQRRELLGHRIGFVPQEPMTALNPSLTIGDHVFEYMARLGVPRRARRDKAMTLFEEVGLRETSALLGRYPHQLSGGMLQRVLIAMAFCSDPRLVIADEPTTALDVTIQAKVIDLIARMRERHGTAVLFITHDLRLAAEICDEATVLYAGRVVESGHANDVLQAPRHPYSRCLQLASPILSGPRRALHVLPDTMPSLALRAQSAGCDFAPRCPLALQQCHHNKPVLSDAASGSLSACFRAEETASIAAPALAAKPEDARREGLILKAEGLAKTYEVRDWLGRVRHVEALRGLNFGVREREFVGVVGESGSGKSTLTKLIMGLEPVTGGTLEVAGIHRETVNLAERAKLIKNVQLIYQDPQSALNPRRRVSDLVTQWLDRSSHRPDREARAASARTALTQVGMNPELANLFPRLLSGGQKQRVNIARSLFASPKLLIADEIVSGLDVSVQAQILGVLAELRANSDFAMLLISHDLSVVRHLCDRVLVMSQGEIVEQGAVDQVFTNPQHPYTKTLIAAAKGS